MLWISKTTNWIWPIVMVRAAWLADRNRENEGQLIGYKFTKKTATFDSQLGKENGALIEVGLDY